MSKDLKNENLIPADFWDELSESEKDAMTKAFDEANEEFSNYDEWDEMDESYQQQQHLIKLKAELSRKKEIKKIHNQNKKNAEKLKKMNRNKLEDDKLIEKVGIDPIKKGQLK